MTEEKGDDLPKGRAKLEDVKLEAIAVLKVAKPTRKEVDLRSPDEFSDWQDNPDDVRAAKKAARKKAKLEKKEESD